jgi:hypothetical protein
MTDVSAIIAAFPNPVLTSSGGLSIAPTFAGLRTLQTEANANAASIHSNGSNGAIGHLHLTMDAVRYLTIVGVLYIPPVNPPLCQCMLPEQLLHKSPRTPTLSTKKHKSPSYSTSM